ncbi:beta-1,3-galactosyltransferase 1-like [Mercenaria mercenaria]|uniref:beta-1,3-galactosyltransferase 1-like n=1 Tax=Mercenaria mercenaria TaxID=6596 RepID=UPI001E1D4474|nr:beta-1,3-galactosyltransferase 1-like [Mercenaria mercenaria]XP_045163381.1 beta-1,3-galactosyltransferase 1-like [Mercenaria mercenaria]
MAFRKHNMLKYLMFVFVGALFLVKYKPLWTHVEHPDLDEYSYYEDIKNLKYPVKVQPNLIRIVNPSIPKFPITSYAPYLIENPYLCSSVYNLTVLVVVNTAADHFERRQTIRETWTNSTYYSHLATVRVLFLLGRTENRIVQSGIQMEFEEHKDILQGDFIDSYFNLTHKGVMGLKWVTERCRNAEMVLKVDDDILVNMFLYLYKLRHDKTLEAVNVYCDYESEEVIRDKTNKWNAGEDHFKGIKWYLKFCKGKFVSMTNDIMPSLYLSASKTPFFHLDDVLLFGYAMHKIPGLRYQALAEEEMQENSLKAEQCLEIQREKCKYLLIHANSKSDMIDVWSSVRNHYRSINL